MILKILKYIFTSPKTNNKLEMCIPYIFPFGLITKILKGEKIDKPNE